MRPLVLSRCFKRPSLLSHVLLRDVFRRRITTTAALPAEVQQIEIPKIIVSPGSAHHNSLPSFLEYATRTNLAPSKTYYVGTHYEYTVALSLLRLGFSLLRTGRKSDAGIDLIGHWILPQLPEPLPVIVQCKVRSRHLTSAPMHVRELEGAFQGIPPEWRKKNVLGLLVTTQKATKGVLECLGGNRWPMGFMKISKDGTIEQLLWNRAASEKGLEGVGVTVRHTPRILLESDISEQGEEGTGWRVGRMQRMKKLDNSGVQKDIQLTWMGSPIFPDRQGPGEETIRLLEQIASEEDGAKVTKQTRTQEATVTIVATKSGTKGTTAGPVKATVKRGRPSGAKSKASTVTEVERGRARPSKDDPTSTPPRRGRPPGSKNKSTLAAQALSKRGRPPGSKNRTVKQIDKT